MTLDKHGLWLAVPQVFLEAGLGLVLFGPSWLEQWFLAVLRISSHSPSCQRWSDRASPALAAWRGGSVVGEGLICTGTWRRNASGVLDPSTLGLGRGATLLFSACTLTRVAVVENFPRVFL